MRGEGLGCISNVLWNSSTVIMQLQNNESTVHLSGWWNELLHLASHYIHLEGKVYCKVKEAGEEREGRKKREIGKTHPSCQGLLHFCSLLLQASSENLSKPGIFNSFPYLRFTSSGSTCSNQVQGFLLATSNRYFSASPHLDSNKKDPL